MSADLARWAQLLGDDAVAPWRRVDDGRAHGLQAGTPVVSPDDIGGAQEVLRFATAQGLRVLPAGALEHTAWGASMGHVDVVLSSRRMNRILEYEPEDLTLVAQAGATLQAIAESARAHQQRLAPDPWPGAAATLGGACAAGRSGLCRLRYGTMRDAVLGARVVHADGTSTRTGGKVVKNVSGYDLAKLYVGSQGSLVFIAELNMRLMPQPHATALVHACLSFDDARRLAWDLHRSRLQPVSIVVTDDFEVANGASSTDVESRAGSVHVLVRFEGRAPVVEQQANACKAQLDGRVVPAARAAWDVLRRFPEPHPRSDLLQVSAVPTSIFDAVANAREVFGTELPFVGLFGIGTTWLRPTQADGAALAALDARLPRGWHLRIIGSAETKCLRPPPAAELQRALKSTFDPQHTLRAAPGVPSEAAP